MYIPYIALSHPALFNSTIYSWVATHNRTKSARPLLSTDGFSAELFVGIISQFVVVAAMERSLHERDRVGVQDCVLLENYNSERAFIENLRKRFKENLIYVSRGRSGTERENSTPGLSGVM